MTGYRLINVSGTAGVWRLTLARPEVRNAFNAELIAEITAALGLLRQVEGLRVLVLEAEGTMFCAGADFLWMGGLKDASYEENLADSQRLFDMFAELYRFPAPTIARVQGGAFGGGCGLVCCCDFVMLSDTAVLAFSEVKIGLVPATISPFVIRKIGEGRARGMFLSGNSVSAAEALRMGLADRIVPEGTLSIAVDEQVSLLLKNGPQAMRLTKEILRHVPPLDLSEARAFTALRIAEQRMSEEGQEGMSAFLEKRKPNW
jgi:methylglutaconyl-CoA hydratase